MAKEVKSTGIKHDGVSFKRSFLCEHRTEAEFLKAMKADAYAHIFEGENREAKLKEVFALAKPKKIKEAETEPEK